VEIIVEPIEKLTIDTPEQVALEMPLAGLGSRFLGVFYDTLIQVIIYLVVVFGMAFIIPNSLEWDTASKWVIAGVILFFFCLYWGYYAIFEIWWKGQTPGKRQAGIRVIKDTGRPITPFEAVARNLVRAVDQIPGFYAVGVLCAFFDKKNRRLGDFVAGTVVVHDRREGESQPFYNMKAESAPTVETAELSVPELELIETFLGRRLDMPQELRAATSKKLADKIAEKIKVPPEARPANNEDFLEAVALRIRSNQRFRQL
jgi:uncharacterized RDD family membrane protein YckC